MDILLEATHITKAFHKKKILQDVSLCLHRHQSIALLGHNGCGKSTLLKILAGISTLDAGVMTTMHNIDIQYIPERFPQLALTAQEYLLQIGRIQGINRYELQTAITSISKDFFMTDLLDTPLRYLSKGSLQKIGVIQALLNSSDVLLMDEPLSGQDIDSQNVFIQKIKNLKKQGVGIIFACHEPYLVQELADYVYTLQDGHIIQTELQTNLHRHTHIILEKQGSDLDEKLKQIVHNYNRNGNEFHLLVEEENAQQTLLFALQNNCYIKEVYHEHDR